MASIKSVGKCITDNCFPSRIWGFIKLFKECWSENYSGGESSTFLHRLCAGALRAWFWATESTRGTWWSRSKGSARLVKQASGLAGWAFAPRNHVRTKTSRCREHDAHAQQEYENVAHLSSNSRAGLIILCHPEKYQTARRSAALPESTDQRRLNTSDGRGLLNHPTCWQYAFLHRKGLRNQVTVKQSYPELGFFRRTLAK